LDKKIATKKTDFSIKKVSTKRQRGEQKAKENLQKTFTKYSKVIKKNTRHYRL